MHEKLKLYNIEQEKLRLICQTLVYEEVIKGTTFDSIQKQVKCMGECLPNHNDFFEDVLLNLIKAKIPGSQLTSTSPDFQHQYQSKTPIIIHGKPYYLTLTPAQ